MTTWIARTLALAALLGFWATLLVLAGLPSWTLALAAAPLGLVLAAAAVPLLGRLVVAAGGGSAAVLARAARIVRSGLALWLAGLAWVVRRSARLAGTGAAAARIHLPRALRGLGRAARVVGGAARRGGGRAGGAAYATGVAAGRRARASAVPDSDRRRRHALHVAFTASGLRGLGRAEEAVGRYEHALAILQALGDVRSEAQTLNDLGLALAQAGDDDRARDCYTRALVILADVGDTGAAGLVRENLEALAEWRAATEEPLRRWSQGLERLERRASRRRKPAARKRTRS